VVLLDDRGWSELGHIDWDHEPTAEERAREEGRIRIWPHRTAEGMRDMARAVVGPDGAFGDHTDAEMAAGHWARWPRTSAGGASTSTPPRCRRSRTTSC
jgi:hypothetical protein